MAHQGEAEIHRPVANFSPSLWGDQFIKHTSAAHDHHHQVDDEEHSKTVVGVLKNEVMGMLTGKMVDTMRLVDTLECLGVSYHFETEIEEKLQRYFDLNTDYNDEAYDLYTVALHFRLFRQHGYRISADIFGRWRDESGKFKECIKNDAEGLLSLYEASYLRTRGEIILDDALD